MKALTLISRLFVGIVFTFSGFVKAVDPLGSTYKFGDYFHAFGMDWATDAALVLAFMLGAVEFLLGIFLIFNIQTRLCAWGVMLFMLVFTPLTLYLAFENPVSDCGCFGDAIILTNWQTFWKNVIIDIFVIILFVRRKKIEPFYNKVVEVLLIVCFTALILGFELYNYRHLPVIDFRPYKEGANIPEGMKIPEGAPQPKYKSVIIYEKDGVQKEFSMDSLPDSTWTWKDTKSILIEKGYEPPIHDFSITTTETGQIMNTPAGEDITDIVLSDENYSMLLVAYSLKKADTDALIKANEIAKKFRENNMNFYCLTASTEDIIQDVKKSINVNFNFYSTDEITLKTVVRANPGYVLLKKGNIIKKWHYNDVPDYEEIEKKYLTK